MKISELKDKKIAILWFWREGKSNASFLLSQWISDITILDKSEVELSEEFVWIQKITWDRYLDDLEKYDYIFKSPGVSPFQDGLSDVRNKFVSGTQIFFENYRGKVIWITGTKGKSTVSTLLYTCLKEAWYSVKLVGNIWAPVLDEIDIISGEVYDYVIYELSSYMLQDFSPKLDIALLNNIYPCHIDWHGDFEVYTQAKRNILWNARQCFVNKELENTIDLTWINELKFFNYGAKYQYIDTGFMIWNDIIYPHDQTKLRWEHNMRNISAVIAVLDSIIQDFDTLRKVLSVVLSEFSGLADRIEDIWTFEGITFINDAIATTPESTMAAIDTFEDTIETLFLGWEDSGFDFKKLREKILSSQILNIVAFPDTSEKIFPEIEIRDYEKAFEIEIDGNIFQIIKTRSMKTGVDFAYKTTLPWKVALLSCGAPSFSLWKSYRDKAEEFKKEVIEY